MPTSYLRRARAAAGPSRSAGGRPARAPSAPGAAMIIIIIIIIVIIRIIRIVIIIIVMLTMHNASRTIDGCDSNSNTDNA